MIQKKFDLATSLRNNVLGFQVLLGPAAYLDSAIPWPDSLGVISGKGLKQPYLKAMGRQNAVWFNHHACCLMGVERI